MSLSINPDEMGVQDSSRLQQLWEVALLGNATAAPRPPDATDDVVVALLTVVSGSLGAGARSAQDGLAVVQTADSAYGDVASLLRRMDLIAALCGAATPLSPTAQSALQAKFEDLQVEVQRIQAAASWKGLDVLAGHDLTFKDGPATEDNVTLDGATTLTPVDVSDASVADPSSVTAALESVQGKRADLAVAKDRLTEGLRAFGAVEQQVGVPFPRQNDVPGAGLSLLL